MMLRFLQVNNFFKFMHLIWVVFLVENHTFGAIMSNQVAEPFDVVNTPSDLLSVYPKILTLN